MVYFADLHLHSKYSRAVSMNMDLEHLQEGALRKGLHILGSGDFSHPKWFFELKNKLVETESGNGLYCLKGAENSGVYFMLQNEVATIISTPLGVKKVHHVVLAPSLEIVSQLNDRLSKMGNLSADGRPIFGKTSPAQMVEICKEVSKEIEIIPAHAWTPWFSIFGSNSGFDSMEAGYGDQARHIFAYETGMSSDPAMNWRLSKLDKFAQISNSDAHSPHPYRIGRECNAFDFAEGELNFGAIISALKNQDKAHFKFTIEVDPNYGKYHFDGHRNCNFCCSPGESKKLENICPKCKKGLTIGVLSRVEELADRPENFIPKGAIPYKTLLPLQDLVASCYQMPAMSRKVYSDTESFIAKFGSELRILLEVPESKLRDAMPMQLASAILANRAGKLKVRAGFDGEYGVLELNSGMKISKSEHKEIKENEIRQKGLGEFS